MNRLVLAMLLVLVAVTLAAPASASVAAPTASQSFSPKERAKLSVIVRQSMTKTRQPGVNVGIWIPGRGSWKRAFGKADLKAGEPMRLADHFRIASITKTFVATAVLQLVDQGKLSLDDKLESYIQGIPNGDQITIRDLLAMTSGIYDFTMDEQFGKDFLANPLLPFTPDDVIAIVKRHDPAFAPGAKVEYCDTNYTFLGVILEKATGEPVEQVIQQQILDPLKLRETSFPTTPAIPAPYAHGYYAGDEGKGPFKDYTATNPDVGWTAGAMISTLADLRVWAKALATGSLLTLATHAAQLEFGTIPNPGGISIGYGLGIFKLGNFIGHNGAILGYSTAMFYLPEAEATIVVEGNQSSNFLTATTTIVFDVAKFLFPGQV